MILEFISNWGYILIPIIVVGLLAIAGYLVFKSYQSSQQKAHEKSKALERVLFLVKVPKKSGKKEEEIRDSKELSILLNGVFEQMISSFSALYKNEWRTKMVGQPHLTFEIATVNGQISFYVSCPKEFENMIEKQIHGQYPGALVEKVPYYNPFKKEQELAVSSIKLAKKEYLPIKTYKNLESDSLSLITNALSKLGDDSVGIVQVVIRPKDNSWREGGQKTVTTIQSGEETSLFGSKSNIIKGVSGLAKDISKAASGKELKEEDKVEKPHQITPIEENTMRSISEKISKVGFDAKVRIITACPTQAEAEMQNNNILAAYSQFANPELNLFAKSSVKNKGKFLADYALRSFGSDPTMTLNTEEIASIFHFPNVNIETPNINWLSAKDAPPPSNIPNEGTVLGESIFRGDKRLIRIKDDDRRRHLYAIGKTGTGKSTLFKNLFLSDIYSGKGACYLDPHGDTVEEILKKLPPSRAEDVVYFDPADTERPMGLNLLEWRTNEQKDFLIQEAVQIFYKLFDPNRTGIVGPQWEHWMRNAALTVMSHPEGGTLIDIPRLFVDKGFLESQLKHVEDPQVKQFWEKQIAQTADFHKSEMLNYFTSKFGRFISNEMMRNIIGQPKSSFDLRKIMDEGKILLVNLSKGEIGEINCNLLGMILVTQLLAASMSRADVSENQRRDFYLYVDEFQNFATDTFAQILSEARKYRLNLNITNQYIAQLPENIRDSVFGNVGTLISFTIGAQDAEYVAKEFVPVFDQEDIINIDKFHCYIKLLVDGVASEPFSMHTIKETFADNDKIGDHIKQLSRLKHGQDKAIIEKKIFERGRLDNIPMSGGDIVTPESKF